ncbi:tyrosine-type recombinase/integrase [Pelagibacterium flavum]|uniref:Tyrosine-type recombinase/integrase n=1 Tax=Pelagibacterium flavum TaxID=2984530 RepID=A0ABY6IKB3_9HYPH|nr:tyrosine-type recombinase/integrase [Pelagibacterium sp. YIM 151497]UYQ71020.1 tyrosine-type recombinase/integrase [Pelagibacterium sp. YIM 151497]
MPLELYPRDGIWWVRGRPADSGDYIRRSLRTSDEAIAQAKVRAIEAQARKRAILGPDAPKPEDEITFAACVVLYDAQPDEVSYLIPINRKIGKMRVKDITPQFIRKLAKDFYPMASTDTWQRQVVTPVRAVINNAHDLGKCPPIRVRAFTKEDRQRQDLFRGKESRKPRTPGSWEWLNAFKEHAGPRESALAHFMFRHGARISQSLAMTRSKDMDLSAGLVRLPMTKGHPAQWVELDPDEVAMIANLPPPYRGAARDRVFYISGGRSGALYRRWKEACDKAGIEYLPPHSAGRHGYGTEMIVRQGVDPISAAKEGRWADPSVMLKTYAHSEDARTKVREAFQVGREAVRTPAVQPEIENDATELKRKRK